MSGEGKLIFFGLCLIVVPIVLLGLIFGGHGSDPSDQYSSCSDLDSSYVDLDTAKCIDEYGDVVYYRDSDRGSRLNTDLP